MLGLKPDGEEIEKPKAKGVRGIASSILVMISETMTSIIEVLLAAGMIAGIMAIISLTGLVSKDSPTYMIFDTLRGGVFHFLPVFIAASAAKRMKLNEYVAMALAVGLLSTNIDGAKGLELFGYHLPTILYSNLVGCLVLECRDKILEENHSKRVAVFLSSGIITGINLSSYFSRLWPDWNIDR